MRSNRDADDEEIVAAYNADIEHLIVMASVDQYTTFSKAKEYFDNGFWTEEMVYDCVGRGISLDQYYQITGRPI